MKFLLDTNIISEIRKRDRAHPNVVRWVARTPVREIGTSVLVLAEIRHGIELKRRSDPEQAKALDRWFSQMRTRLRDRVLPIDEPIAGAWALRRDRADRRLLELVECVGQLGVLGRRTRRHDLEKGISLPGYGARAEAR